MADLIKDTLVDAPQPKRTLKVRNLTSTQKKALAAGTLTLGGLLAAFGVYHFFGPPQGHEEEESSAGEAAVIAEDAVSIPTDLPFAEGVSDDMTFEEAFAAARSEVDAGGFFAWRGGTYNTYYEEEWERMNADQQMEFIASLQERTPEVPQHEGSLAQNTEIVTEDWTYHSEADDVHEEDYNATVAVDKQNEELLVPLHEEQDPALVSTQGEAENMAESTEAVKLPLDMDGDGAIDAIAVDVTGNGIVDAIFMDIDGDEKIDLFTDSDGDNLLDFVVLDIEGEQVKVGMLPAEQHLSVTTEELLENVLTDETEHHFTDVEDPDGQVDDVPGFDDFNDLPV